MADKFRVELTRTAYGHIEALRPFDRRRVFDAIREQLTYTPAEQTGNKKLLRDNPVADWELRVEPFRVFYEVDEKKRIVRVLAVGTKQGNKLFVAGQEIVI